MSCNCGCYCGSCNCGGIDCYSSPCSNCTPICNTTTTTTTINPNCEPCDEFYDCECVIYNGPNLKCYGVSTGDTLCEILEVIIENLPECKEQPPALECSFTAYVANVTKDCSITADQVTILNTDPCTNIFSLQCCGSGATGELPTYIRPCDIRTVDSFTTIVAPGEYYIDENGVGWIVVGSVGYDPNSSYVGWGMFTYQSTLSSPAAIAAQHAACAAANPDGIKCPCVSGRLTRGYTLVNNSVGDVDVSYIVNYNSAPYTTTIPNNGLPYPICTCTLLDVPTVAGFTVTPDVNCQTTTTTTHP